MEASRPFFLGLLFALFAPFALHAQVNYTAPYAITTLVGRPPSGDVDGTGSAARFRALQAIAVDGAGNVYAADSTSHTIRKITSGGVVTTLAGSAGLKGSSDGIGSAARFYGPSGIAVDGEGNVYVADSNNGTIRKITVAGVVSTLAGLAGDYGSEDGTGGSARFYSPHGVAVDAVGNVYVADANNNTIRKITAAGVTTTLAGSPLMAGSSNGTGSAARFDGPWGVAVDGVGNVYVAEINNGTIRKITPARVVTSLAGLAGVFDSTDGTGSNARFRGPQGLSVDGSGNVYVADSGNLTIRKITTATGVVTTFTDTAGVKGWTSGTGVPVQFNYPPGVAVDSSGNLYVAGYYDYSVRKISASGVITILAGVSSTAGANDGSGSAAQFNLPQGIVVNGSGVVYVADAENNTIRKITAAGVTTTFAGSAGNAGSADGTGSAARFSYPESVTVDGAGNIYVADTGNVSIRKITPVGVVSTLASLLSSPRCVAADTLGNVYFADYGSTIRKVTPGGVVTLVAGAASITGSDDGLGSAARFNEPEGLTVDAAGNLYVADSKNATIRKITPEGRVTTLAGVVGDRNTIDGTGSNVRFSWPASVALDGAGNLYVVDNGVRKITPAGVVTTLAGGSTGSLDGTGLAAQFSNLYGIAADQTGKIWLTDSLNNTIRQGVLAAPAFTSAETGTGTVGEAFNYTVLFSGEPTSYGASGLPSGLHINGSTGVVSGTPTAAGSFTVTLSATNTAGTGNATFMLTIAKGYQTVSFGPVADKIYSDGAFTLSATVSSGLSPSYSIVSGPATVSGFTVTLTGVGTVVIRASQVGNSNYNAAADVDQSFTIAKAAATVTLSGLSATYNGSPHFATAVTNPGSLTVAFTYGGSSTAPTAAGTYAVVGTITAANYQGSATGSLVIAKAAATVTLGSLSATYNGVPHAATAVTNPGSLTVGFTYNGSSTAPTAAGTYAVVGTISSANYQGSASGSLVIAKAAATVTLGSLSATYNGTSHYATAVTNPGSLTVAFTYNGSTTAPTAIGTYTVVATISSANYQGSASGSLVIAKGVAAVTLGNLITTYNGSPYAASAVTNPASLAVAFTYNGSATPPTAAGTYTVTATVNDGSYQGQVTGTLIINKAGPVVIWHWPETIVYGTALSKAQLSGTANVPGTFVFSFAGFGQVLGVGPYSIFAQFSPTDTANYYSVSEYLPMSVIPQEAPVITTQPANQKVPSGYGVVFSAVASGQPSPTYQWQKNGANIAGATSSSYSIAAAGAGDQGSYRVIASNSAGSVYSDVAVLAVNSGSGAISAAPSDFDQDGQSDLVWQNIVTGERSFWLMNGATLKAGVELGAFAPDWTIVGKGDFNGDGRCDLIWQNTITGQRSIWLMNGTSLSLGVDLGTYSTDWMIMASGDFNADGQTDIVVQNTITGERVVWLMDGTTKVLETSLGIMPTAWSIAGTGDFNGDGKVDLVWQNAVTGERTVWLMNGTTLGSSVSLGIVTRELQIVGTGDYNRDGKTDLVWTNTTTGERAIWLMNGTAHTATLSLATVSLEWSLERPIFLTAQVAHADFNADGQTDTIWQNKFTGERGISPSNGTGGTYTSLFSTVSTDWVISGSGDFNHDDKPDLVWTNTVTGERTVWLMDGKLMLSSVSLATVSPAWEISAVGDFNYDGKPDLVWSNTVTGERAIWLMNGTVFASGVSLGTIPTEWRIATTADLNGDGKTDLIWQNTSTGECSLWLMNGAAFTAGVALDRLPTQWSIVGTGDFDGDGKVDLLLQNTITSECVVRLMNRTTFLSSVSLGAFGTQWLISN